MAKRNKTRKQNLKRSVLCAALAASLSASLAFAEVQLSYRGMALGDQPDAVIAAARQSFGELQRLPTRGYTLTARKAAPGMYFCNWDRKPSPALKDCADLAVTFADELLGRGLTRLSLVDWFSEPVDFRAVVDKLEAAYGAPRITTNFPKAHGSYTTLVWGGDNTPSADFGAKGRDDFSQLSGKYVAVSLFHNANSLHGYALQLMDREAHLATIQMEQLQRAQELRDSQQERAGSVKF